MNRSRRDLALLLPALAAAQAPAPSPALASKVFRYADLPVTKTGPLTSHQVLNGNTDSGCPIDLHESEVPAGQAPHPPHHHRHNELLLMVAGRLEITISGRKTQVGPGGVAYVAANAEHGWVNVGTTTARYYVLAVGRD